MFDALCSISSFLSQGCSEDAKAVPQEAHRLVHSKACLLISLSILNSTGLYNKHSSNKPAYIIHKTAQSCSAAYGTNECCFGVGGDRVDRNVLARRKKRSFHPGNFKCVTNRRTFLRETPLLKNLVYVKKMGNEGRKKKKKKKERLCQIRHH